MQQQAISLDDATDGVRFSSEYLSGDEKNDIAERGDAFFVTAIARDDANSFGPRWILDIRFEDDDSARKLGLNANPRRNQVMSYLQGKLAGGKVIGPVVLVSKHIAGGQTVWDLVSALPTSAVPPDDAPSDDAPF